MMVAVYFAVIRYSILFLLFFLFLTVGSLKTWQGHILMRWLHSAILFQTTIISIRYNKHCLINQ